MEEKHHHLRVRYLAFISVKLCVKEPSGVCGSLHVRVTAAHRIAKYMSGMSRADQDRSFLSAVKMWSDATPLKFTKVDRGPADIVLTFARRSKEDGNQNSFTGYESSLISGGWSDKEFCLLQLMETSTPLMVLEECWLTPFSRDKGLEETCILMRMKHGQMGDKVGLGYMFPAL